MYRLTRVTPSGAVRAWVEPFADRRRAVQAAARHLRNNHVAARLEALEFAQHLYDAPPGAMVTHRSGFRFYLEQV